MGAPVELLPWPLGGPGWGLGGGDPPGHSSNHICPCQTKTSVSGFPIGLVSTPGIKPQSPGLIALVQESAPFSLPRVPVLPSSVKTPPHRAQGTSMCRTLLRSPRNNGDQENGKHIPTGKPRLLQNSSQSKISPQKAWQGFTKVSLARRGKNSGEKSPWRASPTANSGPCGCLGGLRDLKGFATQ